MKWMKERDALIAQTKAFIESVASKSANAGKLEPGQVRRETLPPPTEPTAIPTQPVKATQAALKPNSTVLSRPPDQVSMTAEIRARIAAFRAHQERFNRERHEYFNATLARLRASIDELPPPARRQIGSIGAARGPDTTPAPPSRAAATGPSTAERRPAEGTGERA